VRRFTWFWIVLALFSYHRRNNTGAIRNPSRIMLLFAASLTAGSISTDLLGMSYGGQHPEHVCSCVAILASRSTRRGRMWMERFGVGHSRKMVQVTMMRSAIQWLS
jgi:hypothetical protein